MGFRRNISLAFMIGAIAFLPSIVTAQWVYSNNNGAVTITGYVGSGGSVEIPNSIAGMTVTSIGPFAFRNNTKIRSLKFSDAVTNIAMHAFEACALTNVVLGSNLQNIEDYAFADCTGLSVVTIPDAVSNIGNHAFDYCALTNVILGQGLRSIGDYCFSRNLKLGEVLFPTNLQEIGNLAFFGCNFTRVDIPDSVTNIGTAPFASCLSLTNVSVSQLNTAYTSVDGVLFDEGKITLVGYPAGRIEGSYRIIDGVTRLGGSAFYNCSSLTNIFIPDSVSSLGNSVFFACGRLRTVTLPNAITNIEASAFCNSGVTSLNVPSGMTAIGNLAFIGCFSLTNITLPNTVTSIGDLAFEYCNALTTVTIPSGVTNLGFSAFYSCSSLAGVYFQGDVPSIGSDAFTLANKSVIYYLPGTSGWGATFGSRPAVMWNPLAKGMAVQNAQFRFDIYGTANIPIVIEASTGLTGLSWVPLQSCTLTNGLIHFSDLNWAQYPNRFYRIRSP